MEFDRKVLEKYNELKRECLDNVVFQQLLVEVEKDIFDKFKTSPESAVEAHYEYQAFTRIMKKINAITVSGEIEQAKLSDYNNGVSKDTDY